MEESHHHHHHHHHHRAHDQSSQNFAVDSTNSLQATASSHSISSADSTDEMAKYFPNGQTPTLPPVNEYQEESFQQTQTVVTPNVSAGNVGPYITVPAPGPRVVQQVLPQPTTAPVIVSRHPPAGAPRLLTGIPSYPSQIDGLSVSQTVVNDVIVDLQSKVINEAQQQYYGESSIGNHLEQLTPIYIRAPNPIIILRSDLHRLRAQLTTRPPAIARHIGGGINRFQPPSFPPPPQQYLPPNPYGQF